MNVLLIASRPRSGTHWLKSLLGSCPRVAAHVEEPFHERYRGRPGFWDGTSAPREHLLSIAAPDTSLIIACCHPIHYASDPRIVPDLLSVVTHVVCLYRRDHVASFTSVQLADRNAEWSTSSGDRPAHGTITVDLNEFRQWCSFVQETLALDLQRWSDRPCRLLAYEDLVGSMEGVLAELGRQYGIDTSHAVAATAKKERRPLWDVVQNYQDARCVAAEFAVP